ncbi:MAG: L,D-transpeptidase family protein [Gammaproteobacteria bacterium]|nr:L,D-transpeptidase family protein [Gammaproteobacteria bacterium]NND54113.1 L,D-transpeptidase family protein [Gammaproteobacteria bacterium]
MNAVRVIRATLVSGVFAGLLSGCAGLNDLLERGRSGSGNPPIISDQFLLNPGQSVIGELQVIEANDQDTFVDIARAYNLGYDEILEANPGIDPWLPGAGTAIVLPTRFILPDAPREGIVINIASKRLFYYFPKDEDGIGAVLTHPIGIGREGSATPLGETTVTAKAPNPAWFPTASIRREYAAEGNPLPARVPPGPDNPLGKFVLKLGMPSYLIHGTNRPAGVGMRVSHGCVRLFPENIAHLYELAPVGTKVTIVNQPFLLAWDGEELLFEAHAPLVDDERDRMAGLPAAVEQILAESGKAGEADAELTETIASEALGIPLPLLGKNRGEPPVEIAMSVNNLVAHAEVDRAN